MPKLYLIMVEKAENHLLKVTMTYGLYLGIAFAVVVLLFNAMGQVHTPGDKSGLINSLLLSFAMLILGRNYRIKYFGDTMLYKQALSFAVLLSVFSSIIFAFFVYWYYGFIEPTAMDSFLAQMEQAISETGRLAQAQQESFIEIYRQGLTPGIMAFAVGFNQLVSGILIGLVIAVFIKSPIKLK